MAPQELTALPPRSVLAEQIENWKRNYDRHPNPREYQVHCWKKAMIGMIMDIEACRLSDLAGPVLCDSSGCELCPQVWQ